MLGLNPANRRPNLLLSALWLVSGCWVLGFFHSELCFAEAARRRREAEKIMARRTRACGIGVVFFLFLFLCWILCFWFSSWFGFGCSHHPRAAARERTRKENVLYLIFLLKLTLLFIKIYHLAIPNPASFSFFVDTILCFLKKNSHINRINV